MEIGKLVEVLLMLKDVIGPTVKEVSRKHGIVHRSTDVEINGIKGILVWDYIIYNEITFDDMEGNVLFSLFNSFSDKETEAKWDELVAKHGVK